MKITQIILVSEGESSRDNNQNFDPEAKYITPASLYTALENVSSNIVHVKVAYHYTRYCIRLCVWPYPAGIYLRPLSSSTGFLQECQILLIPWTFFVEHSCHSFSSTFINLYNIPSSSHITFSARTDLLIDFPQSYWNHRFLNLIQINWLLFVVSYYQYLLNYTLYLYLTNNNNQ